MYKRNPFIHKRWDPFIFTMEDLAIVDLRRDVYADLGKALLLYIVRDRIFW